MSITNILSALTLTALRDRQPGFHRGGTTRSTPVRDTVPAKLWLELLRTRSPFHHARLSASSCFSSQHAAENVALQSWPRLLCSPTREEFRHHHLAHGIRPPARLLEARPRLCCALTKMSRGSPSAPFVDGTNPKSWGKTMPSGGTLKAWTDEWWDRTWTRSCCLSTSRLQPRSSWLREGCHFLWRCCFLVHWVCFGARIQGLKFALTLTEWRLLRQKMFRSEPVSEVERKIASNETPFHRLCDLDGS